MGAWYFVNLRDFIYNKFYESYIKVMNEIENKK